MGKVVAKCRRRQCAGPRLRAHRLHRVPLDQADLHSQTQVQAKTVFERFADSSDCKLQRGEVAEALRSLGCEAKIGAKKFALLVTQNIAKFDVNRNGLDFHEYVPRCNKCVMRVIHVCTRVGSCGCTWR